MKILLILIKMTILYDTKYVVGISITETFSNSVTIPLNDKRLCNLLLLLVL